MTTDAVGRAAATVRSRRGRLAGAAFALIVAVGAARAQTLPADPPARSFDGLLEDLNIKARIAPAPDFVVKSRPAAGSTSFIPVGKAHPERPIKALTPAEVAATTAELDAAREAQQRRAGVKPAPVPLRGTKQAPKTVH